MHRSEDSLLPGSHNGCSGVDQHVMHTLGFGRQDTEECEGFKDQGVEECSASNHLLHTIIPAQKSHKLKLRFGSTMACKLWIDVPGQTP